MRKSGLAFIAGLTALIVVVHVLISDRLIERQLEKVAGRLVGARVELEGFHLSLLGLRVHWEGLQAADPDDPWRNLVQTGPCAFDLGLEPLLKKKLIIENLQAQEIRTGIARQTDGSLPQRLRGRPSPFMRKMSEKLTAARSRIPLLNPAVLTERVDVQGIWESATLQTPQRILLLQQEYEQRFEEWESRVDRLPSEEEVALLENRIREVDLDKLESPEEAARALQVLRETGDQVNRYRGQIRDAREELREKLSIEAMDQRIASWLEEDLAGMLALAGIPQLSGDRVAEMLFGETIVSRVSRIVRVVGAARRFSKRSGVLSRKRRPPRLAGQNIVFDRGQPLPAFWIQRAAFSGWYEGVGLSGTVRNVTSNQRVIDGPTLISASGSGTGGELYLVGTLDYRGKPREQITITVSGISLADMRLADSPLLPGPLAGGTGELSTFVRFEGENMYARLSFTGREIVFPETKGTNTDSDLTGLARTITAGISQISFEAEINADEEELDFLFRSTLDELTADILNSALEDEAAAAREQLESRVHQRIDPLAEEAVAEVAARRSGLDRKLEKRESALDEQQKLVALKRQTLEDRLESAGDETREEMRKKAEKTLKEKVPDSLKQVF
jgi:uncharacterized protein (TIGR03545 family)